MKRLEFPFEDTTFRFELIERRGPVCLVNKIHKAHGYYGYEVVKLQHSPDKVIFGRFIAEHEKYPWSELWGTHGFTYLASELTKAKGRFSELAAACLPLECPLNVVANV